MRSSLILFVGIAVLSIACTKPKPSVPKTKATTDLEKHCREAIGDARIVDVTEKIKMAIGYDLGNTILIRTSAGNIIVDTGISPSTSSLMKKDLLAKYPGRTLAVIFTHSHIDHVGGASEWVEEDTQVWAHANFRENFLKHYGLFQPIQQKRALRQFAYGIDFARAPCSAIGKNPDIAQAMQSGARLPSHTFSEQQTLTFGDTTIELVYAPGETTDQLFVWIESEKALLPGDNIYRAFPNLYTIRGTPPRPVDKWIESIDEMRFRKPSILIPSHTVPVRGAEEIQATLQQYRDGIQWVYDQTVRLTNMGLSADEIVEQVALPDHLATAPFLQELYGQVDWSVRSIFNNNLGWFGGNPADLLHRSSPRYLRREVELMGGTKKVLRKARKALNDGDSAWALHLATKVRRSSIEMSSRDREDITNLLVNLYERAGMATQNTNGRGYYLRSAAELTGKALTVPKHADPTQETLNEIPLMVFFQGLAVRLDPENSMDVHQTVAFHFPDVEKDFYITIRNGVAQLSENRILPGTPEPVATLTMDSGVWRDLALHKRTFPLAFAAGDISVDGSFTSFLSFMNRFDRG